MKFTSFVLLLSSTLGINFWSLVRDCEGLSDTNIYFLYGLCFDN